MHGRDVIKEDQTTLREIIRSIDKKLDFAVRDGSEADGPSFTLHLTMQTKEGNVSLSIDDVKTAKTDLARRHEIRQKIKRLRDHMRDAGFLKDVLGTKAARILRQSSKPEESFHRHNHPSLRRVSIVKVFGSPPGDRFSRHFIAILSPSRELTRRTRKGRYGTAGNAPGLVFPILALNGPMVPVRDKP